MNHGFSSILAELDWTMMGSLVAILTPLGAIPSGLILLYLRMLRDSHSEYRHEWGRRVEVVESQVEDIRRDYATKEEWVREAMHARKQLEKLTEMTAKIETQIIGNGAVASQMTRALEQMGRVHADLVAQISKREVRSENWEEGRSGDE